MLDKIYFNTRDELTCIDTDLIALVQADGNYSKVIYITGKHTMLTHGISKIGEVLKLYNNQHNIFVRLGRSIIINHNYFQKIDLQKSVLFLGNGSTDEIRINLSKKVLKSYKEAIIKKVEIQGGKRIWQKSLS